MCLFSIADYPISDCPDAAPPGGVGPNHALTVGIGCRRGACVGQIEAAVRAALGTGSMRQIARIATIAAKANEPAIAEFCARHAVPLRLFSVDEIDACAQAQAALRRAPDVRRHVGVDGVCEPCALLATPGGRLIVAKRVLDGVTVAIAAEPMNQRKTGHDGEPSQADNEPDKNPERDQI